MTDPYKILGVSQTAAQDDIKAAYRKLAKKNHPDLNPGNKEAEKKFKEVSHAFDQISTPEARGKWDRGETDEQKQKTYEEYSRKQRSRSPHYADTQAGGGRYSHAFGEGIDDDLFSSIFGRAKGGSGGNVDLSGEDELYHLEVDFQEAARGGEKIISMPNGKKLQVKIPAGIQEGQKLKFKGMGGAGTGKGPAGNAYVQITIRPSEKFSREGQDIASEVPVSVFEALAGAEIEVPTIDGNVLLKVPAGVSSGSRLRIRGKGAGSGEDRGNHIVVLKVVLPKEVPEELREEARRLKSRFDYSPRSV